MIRFLFFFFFFSLSINAQIGGEDEVYLNGDGISASFQGDDTLAKFGEYLKKEFDFSKVTKSGRMTFSFTVDESGAVKNIKVVELLDIASATEIIRVMKKCPKWEPAKKGGKPISVAVKYPMTFNSRKL